jgi:adenylyltransferase/sulfurtransferase
MNFLLLLFVASLSSKTLGFTIPFTVNFPKSTFKLGMTTREKLTNGEISRYSRHLVLEDVGVKGQTDIKNASVLVIGAGGLGSPCLMYLAAAGVGYIGIVDADVVDESNLQRQIIHGTSTINISKCQSAEDRIRDINPNVHVRTYKEEFTSVTAMRILGEGFSSEKKWDVVVDGSDNFPTKYLINDACEILDIPWVYSAILAFEGQLSVFNYKGGPNYRDMMPLPPAPGDVPSCAEGGVLGVLPGVCGCLQATEVLKIILGKDAGLMSGRILKYDALAMTFSEARVEKSKDRNAIVELIDYQGFCAGPKAVPQSQDSNPKIAPEGGRTMDEVENVDNKDRKEEFSTVQPMEALEKLKNGWSPWVLDVRLQTEHDITALPFTDMVAPHRTCDLNHIPVDGDVLVYCKAGVRGKKACTRLIELGVDPKRLFNLDGGIMRWRQDVDPTIPRY